MFGGGEGTPGIGGTGQFSLQSSHEGGYQLNLPLGLQAGNVYRGGVRSGGHYGGGGLQPQIRTDHQQFPDSRLPTGYQPFDQRQPFPLPPDSTYPSAFRGTSDVDMRKIPSPSQPDTSVPAVPIFGDRRVLPPAGVRPSETPTSFHTSDRRQPGIDYESQLRRQTEHRTMPSAQVIPTAGDRSTFPQTPIYHPSSAPDTRLQIGGYQPGTGVPSIYMPSGTIQGPLGVPGQIPIRTHTSDISDMQRARDISRPSQIHDPRPGLIPHQQYIPSGSVPEQQYLQTPDIRHQTGLKVNGDIQKRPVPPLLTPGYPGYPSITDVGKQEQTDILFPGSPMVPSIPHMTRPISHETIRNGAQSPDATRIQTDIKDEYPSTGFYPGMPRVPIDTRRTVSGEQPRETPSSLGTSHSQETIRGQVPIALRPSEAVQDTRYNRSIPSRGVSETSMPTDRRITSDQTGFETSRVYGRDSASSQTQIQTGFEGTAAEASAAGHHGGLGSQTQVQGGYAGNGSFSAQAQSGFTGGVVQSQVQGGKQGGLSGSSAQVERVGSAQSQVQILQPSGSASSTAQGRFTGGTTQVQAQSSKTGGSAGAQAQSTGLSSSHVQVNVGGNDVSKDEQFQGTVSAAVHGGQSSGQSQTQLQGGYDSGRTYAATAQGGFDTALEFQASVPLVGSLTNLSSGILNGQQLISAAGNQGTRGTFRGDQRQISGMPTSRDSTDITQQALMPPAPQTGDSRTPYPSSQTYDSRASYPNSVQGPLPPSIYRGAYPGYPAELSAERIHPRGPGDFSQHRGLDERGVVLSSYPQAGVPGTTEQQTRFGIQVPETQDRTLYETGSPRQTYPTLPVHTTPGATDQHHALRTPSSYPQLPGNYHPSTPFDSRYIPSFPSMPQHPGLSEQAGVHSRHQFPSQFPDQPQISIPSSQMIPSYRHPSEMPVLTRPDGSFYIEPTHRHLPMPDQAQIQPQQPQLLFPSEQVQTGGPRSQIPSQQTSISQPRPQIRIEHPQIAPLRPPISTTTEKIPLAVPSETTARGGVPGVTEPDKTDCCAALRDLKRRCCSGTSKLDKTSPCCRSSKDDIFDFSSEDDLDEDKEPCKIVKAICYIVYKPVGKARVCKPTATNGC